MESLLNANCYDLQNSIRHNLSLHNRFMRVQNEGTGKSSWWMINPDAKPGKAARRRATSMETQKYEKKRGRVKKKIEALKNGLTLDPTTPSPSSSVSEGLDMFPESPLHHGFQLSPEFRPRASSNASSCGRLSPIPAVENDMHDSQVPPLSPLAGWSHGDIGRLYGTGSEIDQYSTEQLVEMATTMKLGGNTAFLGVTKTSPTGQLSPAASQMQLNNTYNTIGNFGSLSGYSSPGGNGSTGGQQRTTANGQSSDPYYQTQPPSETGATTLTALNNVSGGAVSSHSPSQLLLASDVLNGVSNGAYSLTSLSPVLSSTQSMDTMTSMTASTAPAPTYSSPQHHNSVHTTAHNRGLSTTLTCVAQRRYSVRMTNPTPCPTALMGHLLSLNNPLPNDLDLNFDSLNGGLECDVDSVIRHELSVDGSLDFNFADPLHHSHGSHAGGAAGMSQSAVSAHNTTMTTTPSSRSWVH
ncbi:unnamed protein product [Oppiella nova]|uniref:Fork-head domain-containing protein n=1 Tax=Oppiella nova TaxID=334625 RepID=A0A7R9LS73_9ACAR|nr:unnamed protein product [Oppiella nova]CAG2166367.1 unnamed protein product [Oppiella nova]